MNTIKMVALPFTFLAAAVMLGGCVGAEPGEGDEALDAQTAAQTEPEQTVEAEETAEAADALTSDNVCYSNTTDFALPNKPDISVTIKTCVESTGYNRRAYLQGSWSGSLGFIGGKRFDSFVVYNRLERYDTSIAINDCDLTGLMNNEYSGTFSCVGPWHYSTSLNGWSGDGKAVYNIDADGLGNKTWDLHGSPLIP